MLDLKYWKEKWNALQKSGIHFTYATDTLRPLLLGNQFFDLISKTTQKLWKEFNEHLHFVFAHAQEIICSAVAGSKKSANSSALRDEEKKTMKHFSPDLLTLQLIKWTHIQIMNFC